MDYSCRDIPMRLDIRYQPLNFEIYLSQVIEVPRTSLEDPPYDFHYEIQALETVDKILQRTQEENEKPIPPENLNPSLPAPTGEECNNNSQPEANLDLVNIENLQPPSCPTETPLTPIKSTLMPTNSTSTDVHLNSSPAINQINPKDFEEMHYNPFDHLELQTIDELKELDLVFQASYANQSNNSQLQTTSEGSTPDNSNLS